jgi:hypothetical protein
MKIGKILENLKFEINLGECREFIKKNLSEFEKRFNIKIKMLIYEGGDGMVYLTTNNKIIKFTNQDIKEYKLLKEMSYPYFPKIYSIIDDFCLSAVLKEYIKPIPNNLINAYNDLEKILKEFISERDEEEYDYEMGKLISDEFINVGEVWVGETAIKNYGKENNTNITEILKVYNDLIKIFEYAENYLDRDFLDIHIKNLGYNGKNLVLYDF